MVREVKMDKGRKQVQEAYRKEVRGPAQQVLLKCFAEIYMLSKFVRVCVYFFVFVSDQT